MKIIKAVYDFLVGDMIILVGMALALLLLTLLQTIEALHSYTGAVLVVITLLVLGITLRRELVGRK
ncbi:MAG TPA: hypothetical protein VKR06_01735 [Ktedonosporobacter sp.]|nr:hypothetical protein [Ktedonosporobacter sp.]